MLAPIRTKAPDATPVSLDEVKRHLRVDGNDNDLQVAALIAAATNYLDGWSGILGCCIVKQEWRQEFKEFDSCLPLPLGPATRIVSVTDGSGTIVAPANYTLATYAGGRSRIEFSSGTSVSGPISVTYEAGAADAENVPATIKVAIALIVRDLYVAANASGVVKRETVEGVSTVEYHDTTHTIGENPAVKALIAPFRRAGM